MEFENRWPGSEWRGVGGTVSRRWRPQQAGRSPASSLLAPREASRGESVLYAQGFLLLKAHQISLGTSQAWKQGLLPAALGWDVPVFCLLGPHGLEEFLEFLESEEPGSVRFGLQIRWPHAHCPVCPPSPAGACGHASS